MEEMGLGKGYMVSVYEVVFTSRSAVQVTLHSMKL